MWSLSEWRRQRILAQHPVTPDVWHNVRQHLSILDGLNDEQDKWLRDSSVLFLQAKHLTPMPGVELTEEGRLLLSSRSATSASGRPCGCGGRPSRAQPSVLVCSRPLSWSCWWPSPPRRAVRKKSTAKPQHHIPLPAEPTQPKVRGLSSD